MVQVRERRNDRTHVGKRDNQIYGERSLGKELPSPGWKGHTVDSHAVTFAELTQTVHCRVGRWKLMVRVI